MQVNFKCYYCGADCAADGSDGNVYHAMPMCKAFKQYDPLEFITLCRTNLEEVRKRAAEINKDE